MKPMLGRLVRELPLGEGWRYEPKWDGFRCLAARDGDDVDLRSRHDRPFARYFPEVVSALLELGERRFTIDGEVLVPAAGGAGAFDFGALMLRLHPSASRVERLAREHPALFVAFDLLAAGGEDLTAVPFAERRARLEALLAGAPDVVRLTPQTGDPGAARAWLADAGHGAIDGVMAKRADEAYRPGARAMLKVKPEHTADCVVGGFRGVVEPAPMVTSLLLGLYDDAGGLRHVGVASAFGRALGRRLLGEVRPYLTELEGHPWEHGFLLEGGPMGRLKGAAGRWEPGMPMDWLPLRPELVCEVAYGQVDGGRFRHPATWRRWRVDREPASCRFDQLAVGAPQ
ncbi:MAG TPA: ATP-dependent DNA ligase [Capillimicrobium sp.]|nr:ATP-dependent DNA ligase [Capillimicrobium sp.]